MIPKLMPLPTMIEPRNAVFEFSSVMPKGGRLASAERVDGRQGQRQEQRQQAARTSGKRRTAPAAPPPPPAPTRASDPGPARPSPRRRWPRRREARGACRARSGRGRPARAMSSCTRWISAAACDAPVEKPPTSMIISVEPSARFENRLPSQVAAAQLACVLALDVARSPGTGPARCRPAACRCSWRTPSAAGPRCAARMVRRSSSPIRLPAWPRRRRARRRSRCGRR